MKLSCRRERVSEETGEMKPETKMVVGRQIRILEKELNIHHLCVYACVYLSGYLKKTPTPKQQTF